MGLRALIDAKPFDLKLQSLSDLDDDRSTLTIVRRDNQAVAVSLTQSDLEFWAARIASILDKVKGDV
jgi:hypothetical protein